MLKSKIEEISVPYKNNATKIAKLFVKILILNKFYGFNSFFSLLIMQTVKSFKTLIKYSFFK